MSLEPRVVALEVNQKHISNNLEEIKTDQKLINKTMMKHMRQEEKDRMGIEKKMDQHKWMYLGGVGAITVVMILISIFKT